MRRNLLILSLALATTTAGIAYAASPFWAAWTLREAIRTGDIGTIERRVQWAPVRQSLRASIVKHADLAPIVKASGRRIRPTLWQRVKRVFGASMIDRFIETKITAEGLHKLFVARDRRNRRGSPVREPTIARLSDSAAPEPHSPETTWRTELRALVSRLVHARFVSPTTVQIQVADTAHADRHYRGTMELIGITWMLTRLEVIRAQSA